MDADSASEFYVEAVEAWQSGDYDTFLDSAHEYNEWLMSEGMEPLSTEEWSYDDSIEYADLQEWIDGLNHDDRERFYGY